MHRLTYGIVATAAICVAALSSHAVEWSLTVEKDGATNVVTAAGNPFAIDVSSLPVPENQTVSWLGQAVAPMIAGRVPYGSGHK